MRNNLDGRQMFALCNYVQFKWDGLLEFMSNSGIALSASEELGFNVTSSNVDHAIDSVGLVRPNKTKKQNKDRTQVIAQELVRLMNKLGEKPSDDLVDVSKRK